VRPTLAGCGGGSAHPRRLTRRLPAFAFTSLKVFWLQAVVGTDLPAYVVLACRRAEFRPPRTWMMLALLTQLRERWRYRTCSQMTLAKLGGETSIAWTGLVADSLWRWAMMAAGVARTWQDWRRLLHIEISSGCRRLRCHAPDSVPEAPRQRDRRADIGPLRKCYLFGGLPCVDRLPRRFALAREKRSLEVSWRSTSLVQPLQSQPWWWLARAAPCSGSRAA